MRRMRFSFVFMILCILSCAGCGRSSVSETTLYYDFSFGDKNAGYFEVRQSSGKIYMNAKFEMGGELLVNPFEITYEGEKVLAVRAGDGEWLDFSKFPANHYPTSAYPLLLPRVKDELGYISVEEGSGRIIGEILLKRVGDTIHESKDGKTIRKFRMKDGVAVEIDWGGPVSHLKSSLEEAVKGSPLEGKIAEEEKK